MKKEEGKEGIRILVGGHLREELGLGEGEIVLETQGQMTVAELLERLGLAQERAKLVMVNGKGGSASTALNPGDRVAIFPPELSFNTFVSLCFRKERVEARTTSHGHERGTQGA